MSTFLQRLFVMVAVILLPWTLKAQQLTNASFEDWNGEKFDGEIQPTGWNASNVEQVGFKFNFAHRESGHTGNYSMMVQDQDVGAAGITETSPGYFALGQPWVYLASITKISEATAGTYGGISFAYRPDSMSVWIKRTGNNTDKEDFYLLYYSWTGTAKGEKYKGKNGNCTSVSKTDEESDVRQALDGNECGTIQKATQIAEGMWREKKAYSNWTKITVPIFYFNEEKPQKMNIIFSASNYPNFRANSGLYAGNSLYVDDVELIYSAKIQKLFIGDKDKEWKGFDPNTEEVQTYSLGETATSIPAIYARRGAGSLTNAKGTTVSFKGRLLEEGAGKEMQIVYGDLENTPTTITVKSEDGKSQMVYKIQFQRAPSTNATLAEVFVNGSSLADFRPAQTNYTVELPYGTTTAPVLTYTQAEDAQTVTVNQATSPTGTATIIVTAADKTTKKTYTFNFTVGELKDATLKDIMINGKSIPGYTPSQAIYKVSLPVSTTSLTVEPVSAYAAGEQKIEVTPNPLPSGDNINGSTIQIKVTAGTKNPVTKTYKLNIKLEKSTYSYLADLQVVGDQIMRVNPATLEDSTKIAFASDVTTYYLNLKMGTKQLPQILWTPGDEYQTIKMDSLAEGVVDGTVRITVTAGNGTDQTVYKLVFSAEKSEISTLNGINIDGTPIPGFRPDSTYYTYELPIEATTLPEVTPVPHDEFQEIKTYAPSGLVGKYRISVTAGNGTTTNYYIDFKQLKYTDNTLKSLSVAGYSLQDKDLNTVSFDPQVTEYWVNLASDATEVPEVSLELQNALYQDTVVRRPTSTNGDYKVTVRPRSGTSRIYTIHFVCKKSSNTALSMIYITDTVKGATIQLPGFEAEKLSYTHVLDTGAVMPVVTWDAAETTQTIDSKWEGKTLKINVKAQSGATRTYKIKFVIPSAASTQVEMIYLDGVQLPGFRKDSLEYTYELPYGTTCPKITVTPAAGQQVTITAPYAAGTAVIKVATEDAEQDYTIEFISIPAATVQLSAILVNNMPLAGFAPTQLNYFSTYEGDLPVVQGLCSNPENTISVVWNDTVAWLHVQDVEGNKAAYSVNFTHNLSTDNTLAGIYEDKGAGAQLIEGFNAAQLNYAYNLAPGSTYPALSYKVSGKAEVVFFGQLADGKWGITVVAENGAEATYTVQYTIEKYSDATLQNISAEGQTITFDPLTFEYNLTLDEGAELPQLSVETREGQTVLVTNVNDTLQKVIVFAESRATNTYLINYTRVQSTNALLADIKIGGVSLPGFDPEVTYYVDSLDRGTTVVPNVFPIGQNAKQTITTYFSKPNGVTRIHVESQTGASQDYFVAFPIKKSNNNLLDDVLYLDPDVTDINFKPTQTDYVITLPYETTACPRIIFEKGEAEQRIDVISRPLGDTTKVIVYAENGDARTYSFLFKREVLKTKNLLSMIRIVELDQELSLKDKTKRDFDVEMPYGSRSLTVEYEKMYNTQTVFIQPGGVNNPTVITVKANNDTVADEVYRILPTVPTADPAVLTDIRIKIGDGAETTIPGFNSEQFSYIVKVTDKPKLRYSLNKGAEINIIDQTTKHWQAEVTYGDRTNTYNIWYYYENDVVPNMDFNNWENAKTTTSAKKPTGWNVLGDFAPQYTYLTFTFTPGEEVQQDGSNSVAYLHTKYNSTPLAGYIPGYMTLGNISYHYQRWGSSAFSVEGGITFRNTPDEMSFRIKVDQVNNNSRILYTLNGSGGENTLLHEEGTTSGYVTRTMNLADANAVADEPTQLNITFNSFDSESGKNGTAGGEAKMYVDWMKLAFNHTLASMKANGLAVTKTGTAFEVTLDNSEYIEKPILSFTGEVRDQAQDVVWTDTTFDADFEIRTATIRNWAENGTDYTDYTLTVKRPLDTKNQLSDLLVDSITITGFNPAQTDYTIHMPSTRSNMNDIIPVPGSSLQTVTTSFADSTMTITVTPEKGEATVYKVRFVTDLSDDTTLENITAEGITYDADTRDYNITAVNWPLITFVKKSDKQTVTMLNGVITVTAENGAVGTYTITRNDPAYASTGLIENFYKGTNIITGFGETELSYEAEKPVDVVSFDRKSERDSVVFVQTPAKMEWQVYGSANNTYVWTYPTEQSTNTELAAILVDGVPYSEFVPAEHTYTIPSDTTVVLSFIASDEKQQIVTTTSPTEGGVLYTTVVTAESGAQSTYNVAVTRPKSNIATLAGILLDSVMIDGFDPVIMSYTVTLPAPQGAKMVQPKMPNITYIVGQRGQKVTVETGQLNGDNTVLTVVSEDGEADNNYNVTINAEPSHCSDLTGITVNGEALDHFEPGRHFYSVALKTDDIEIGYTSDDRFQKVQTLIGEIKEGSQYRDTLHVIAEDGSFSDYLIEIYIENQSNDAQLANILLDNMDFVTYGLKSSINPDIKAFDPAMNEYHINVIRDSVPLVSAQLKMDGQSVQIETFKDSVYLHVWAVDSTLNTYKLYFEYKKSTNTALSWITINADSILAPTAYFYTYDKLKMGEDLPIVDAEPVNEMATVNIDRSKNPITITVTAEDDSYKAVYTISCDFKPSTVNTLEMIYENGKPLPGFEPMKFNYDTVLNAGESFPTIDYGELTPRDSMQWPYIDSTTVTFDPVEHVWVHQTTVTAQSNEMKVYTLSYTIRKWDVDTLESIEVENVPLAGFTGSEQEYYYTFTPKQVTELDGRAPFVKWFKGEDHQLVDSAYVPDSYKGKSLGYKHVLTVRAENNATRTYTIHYPVELSSDATLKMINIDEVPLKDFDSERNNYKVELDFGLPVPNVTAITWNEDQIAKQSQIGDTVFVDVWAEDKTHNMYTIAFERVKSNIATLDNIIIYDKSGKQFPYDRFEFASDSFDYVIVMPFDSTMTEMTLPEMKYIKSDPFQTVSDSVITNEGNFTKEVLIHVVAPNNEDEAEYKLLFQFTRNNDAALTDIKLNKVSVKNFKPTTLDYKFTYPYGSDSTAFVTNDNVREVVSFTKSDLKATDTVYVDTDASIVIVVTAQDKKSQNTYSIQQIIGKDTVNTIKMLYMDGDSLKGFDPEQTFYIYKLKNGASTTPAVYGIPMSVNAEVDATEDDPKVGVVNDTLKIYCTAQDGSERIYRIYFEESTINDALSATANDVLVHRVQGANQLFVATIRKDVTFIMYDYTGRRIYYNLVPDAEPNDIYYALDSENKDVLLNVDVNPNSGLLIDIDPGQVYLYNFVERGKKKIKSGKIMAMP